VLDYGNFVNAEMVKAFNASIEYRQRFGPWCTSKIPKNNPRQNKLRRE